MGQNSRFWYFPFEAFSHLCIEALFTACFVIMRFSACCPFCPLHFWYLSKSGWSGFIKTSLFYPRAWNLKFRVLETMPVKTPAKWINNPDGIVSRFGLPLFPAGLMWQIVIRFTFLVCRQKYALQCGNLWPIIFSPLLFIFSLHRFPAIFWPVSVWHMILPESGFLQK